MKSYYAARAPEYDRVYLKPERQTDLRAIERWVSAQFAGANVLEIACGTGYWTQFIATQAHSVYACDINEPVLEIAREKRLPPSVHFFRADAVGLDGVPSGCNAAFAGFWWSHVKKADIAKFVQNLAARLEPGAKIVVLDNQFHEGSSTPLSRRDEEGNTYQVRKLANGDAFEILKNFPTPEEFTEAVRGVAHEAHLETLQYYWLLVFTLK